MSSQDPYSLLGLPNGVNLGGLGGLGGITIDPTTGQISIGGTSGSGSYPWPTGGNPNPSQPASTGTSSSGSNSLFDWLKNNAGQVAGAGATALGAYLNYSAQQARNNLLQQQISSNNTVSAADQARRDYYASILMPSILQGLRRQNDPASMAAVQGQQAQAMHFPAPLSFSGTGVTQAPAATTTPAATPVGTTNPAASAGNFTTSTNPAAGSTTFNQAYSAATGQIPNSGYLYNPNLDSTQI